MYQKNIKLFLVDGEIDGRIKCELSNSNILAYKIPKTKVKECKSREDIGISFGGKYGTRNKKYNR